MNWKSHTTENTISWLLEDENPSVKYFTLKDLLSKPEHNLELKKAKSEILNSKIVKKIFSKQNHEGFWSDSQDLSSYKGSLWSYKGTAFTLLILSELGVSRCEKIEGAIEFLFQNYQLESGFFSPKPYNFRKYKSKITSGWCVTSNLLKILVHFGYLEDERTRRTIQFFIDNYLDGWKCKWYPSNRRKVVPKNCYMGGVKTLSAFSKIPERNRTREIRKIIEENVEIYLKNQIFKYRLKKNGERTEKSSWKKFGFPLFWQSDTLEVLDVLTSLGVKDERMQDAIDLVVSRQGKDGRWKLERTYNSWIKLEKVGEPSKWITLRALRVLKRFYG